MPQGEGNTGVWRLDRLCGSPMEMGRFLPLTVKIAAAVEALHRENIVHKNINPRNILVDPATGAVTIVGPPRASHVPFYGRISENLRKSDGTPAYMSPEQTGRMNRVVDSRTDLYSLGVTLYQMLTGELPFRAADTLEWVHCHIARMPLPPAQVVSSIPAMVSAIVMRLLAKATEERYQTALGLKLDLERCCTQWEAAGTITPFALGKWDTTDRLLIPQQLYGREKDRETLLAAFQRVVTEGAPEVVMVAGYSGIGKTSLVRELFKPVVRERGYFISAKFEQFKRDIPYLMIVQAFKELIQQILTESEERLADWRRQLQAALGLNGQIIVDVVPQIELIIGKQQRVPELPSTEAQNRFNMVFRQFLGIFAKKEHPLVVFLDDLQWADSASLRLLDRIISHPEAKHLLLVGAYRDNEVSPSHPLMTALEAFSKSGVPVLTITLSPLSFQDLERLVRDTFHSNEDRSAPLTKLVYEKTAGNPFFVIQFLTMLHDESLVEFDTMERLWKWDIARIQATGYTDNVVDLMVRRLRNLSIESRQALTLAACIGNTFDLHTLALINDSSPPRATSPLPAVTGIVGPRLNHAPPTSLGHGGTDEATAFRTTSEHASLDENIHELLGEAAREGLVLCVEDTSCRFLHDRVQQAAYSLIPKDHLSDVHLRIGRLLLAATSSETLEDGVFDIVNHMNLGAGLIADRTEKDRLAELNFLAGRKAKASVAYVPARGFLAAAAGLLPGDAWEARYHLAFTLYAEYAESTYLCGDHKRAEELFVLTTEKARTAVDKATVYNLRLKLYQVAGKFDEAVTLGLEALRLFGVTIPESDQGIQMEIEAETRAVETNLRGRNIAELLDAATVTDPEIRAIIELLGSLCPCSAMARPTTYPWFAVKMANYTLTYGNTDEASVAYFAYALWAIPALGHFQTAFDLVEMALKLNDKFDGRPRRGRLLYLFAYLINFWRRPLAEDLPILDEAFMACLDVGDLLHASFVAFGTVWHALEKGEPLDDVLGISRKFAAFTQESKNEAVYQTIRLEQQFVACLKGLTREPLSFDDEVTVQRDRGNVPELRLHDESFDETASFASIVRANFGWGISAYYIMKQILAFMCGRYEEALTFATEAPKRFVAVETTLIQATSHFYHALTLAALYSSAPAQQQSEFLEAIEGHVRKLKLWANNCPETFGNRFLLVSAELARITGKDPVAMRLYEQAIQAARKNGFVQNEGLANELAARFYREREFETIANTYLREAMRCYRRWGANGKVRQLYREQPWLQEEERATMAPEIGAQVDRLDTVTLIKASQAISGEIVLSRLLDRLMRTMLESAGAQKGYLILARSDELSVEAEARVDGPEIRVAQSGPFHLASTVPISVVNYAKRTKESVILEDASRESMFRSDPYILTNRPMSILCLPLVRQAHLVGLLYLENSLVKGAFTADRIAILELLAAQAAISLENAALYLERSRAEDALRQSEELFRIMADSSPVMLWMSDIDGLCTFFNKGWLEFRGRSMDQEIGNGWAEGVHLDDFDRCLDTYRSSFALREDFRMEYRLKRHDGEFRWIMDTGVPRFELNGDFGGYIGSCVDITERKRTEEELRIYREHLEELVKERTKELSTAKDAAEAANLTKSAFLAHMSHELRTPMTAILGYSQLMQRDISLPSKQREYVDIIYLSGEHLLGLINDVLDLSRIEAKRVTIEPVSFNLHDLLRDLQLMFVFKTDSKGLQFRLDGLGGLPRHVVADEPKLRQVLINVLENAVKFTDKGSIAMRVRVMEEGSNGMRLMVEVEDTGSGIAEEELEQAFKPFEQTATGRRSKTGSGLGLAISRDYARMMGGDLTATSRVGEGSIFRLEIGIKEGTQSSLSENTRKHRVIGLQPGQTLPRILVAEDQEVSRTLLVKLLKMAGFDVKEAVNGREAVEIAEKWQPHFIWMDIRLPVMDGLEAAWRIKAAEGGKSVVIAALTASALEEDRHLILSEESCDDFVRKPYRERDIFEVMAKHLGVRYVYEEEQTQERYEEPESECASQGLAALPAELRSELRESVLRLDLARTLEVVEKISRHDGLMGAVLKRLADNLDYDRMLTLSDADDTILKDKP